ncbi:MAG: MFS transporter [Crocosphaera sp.]|nr:MFS transporter [Crocosphaera sp.]
MTRPFLGPTIVGVTFLTLMGAFGLNLTGGQFFTPLHLSYGWDVTTLSLAVSLNMLTWGLLQPVMGRLIDRIGAKFVLTASALLMGIAFLLSSSITEIWQFFLYYGIFTGIGFAGCGSMANSVLVSQWYLKKRPMMLARSSMGINIGQLVLLPLTGVLIANTGFRTAFLVLGLIMVIIVVPAILLGVKSHPSEIGQYPDGLREAPTVNQATQSSSLLDWLKTRDFWVTTLGFMSCGYTLYLVTTHLPKYAFDLGGSTALGGQLLGLAATASAVSMWLTGQFSQTLRKKPLLIGFYLLRTFAFVWLATSRDVSQLYLFALLYGISSFPIIPLVTSLMGTRFGTHLMGSLLGCVWLLHQVAAAVGVFVGGYLRSVSGDYHLAFWSCAFFLSIGTLVTFFAPETPTRPQPAKVSLQRY